MSFPLIFLGALVSSVLYRAGGLSREQPYWIPVWMRRSWVRDWLCPIACLYPLYTSNSSWLFFLSYGLMGAAFTTYWKRKGEANYWLAGFFVGIAAMPLIFCGFSLWTLFLRALFIAISWGAWCEVFGNDHAEEHGRGFFVGISSLLI